MTLKLIHTADWQIGKPFGRLEAERAAVLRRARDAAIDRIGEVARRTGATHVLVAGDVFDSEALPDLHVRQTLNRLAAATGVNWHLLPGNHDPARPGGIWDAVRRLGVPSNVQLYLEPGPSEMAPGIQLLAAPLHAKSTSVDPTRWMDGTATPEGHVRIGMAHGSIQGFGSLGEAAVPIDPVRARKAGLAYLALGDWHGVKEIGPATWYAGTPEPDSFADNDPGFVLAIEIDGPGSQPRIDRIATAAFHWRHAVIRAERLTDLDRLEQELALTPAAVDDCLLEIQLEGRFPAATLAALDRRLVVLAGHVFHLRIDRRQLTVAATDDDVAELSDGPARVVGQQIRLGVGNPDPVTARRASRALELLFAIDAEVSDGAVP